MLSVLQAIIFAEMKGSLHTLFETLHLEDFRGKLQTPIFSDPHLARKAKKIVREVLRIWDKIVFVKPNGGH